MVCAIVGSATWTGWNLRSSAASFSRCLRYSSSVVAPIVCSSPRASIGLRIEAASIAPSAAPAPTSVCSSSMNKMMSPRVRISLRTFFSRSSKSPRYLAPATSALRSRVYSCLPVRVSGTSPWTIFWARPSTTAVLPTPGSPTSTGLFLVRRDSTCMTRSISFSRPITGSSLPSRAAAVRLRPNWSSMREADGAVTGGAPAAAGSLPGEPASSWITCWRTLAGSAPSLSSTWAATPSPSRIRPSRMCSVPM